MALEINRLKLRKVRTLPKEIELKEGFSFPSTRADFEFLKSLGPNRKVKKVQFCNPNLNCLTGVILQFDGGEIVVGDGESRGAFCSFSNGVRAVKFQHSAIGQQGKTYRYVNFYDSNNTDMLHDTQWIAPGNSVREPSYFYSKHIFPNVGEVSKTFKPGYELIGVCLYTNDAGEVTWFDFLTWPEN